MNLGRRAAWILALALGSAQILAAETAWLFTGQASSVLTPAPSETDLRLGTGLEADLGPFSGRVLGGLHQTGSRPEADLAEAWVALSWPGTFDLQGGWWPETAGPGLFHSAVALAAQGPDTELLATAGSPTARTVGKVEARFTTAEWTLKATYVPVPPAAELPDAASLWIPRRDIPTSFDLAGTPVLLGPLGFAPSRNDLGPAFRVSVTWSALWGTWSAGWFQGPDSQVIFPARFQPFQPNRLTLRPVRHRVTRGWTTLEAPLGPVSLWLDSGLSAGRARAEEGWEGSDAEDGTYLIGKVGTTSAAEATGGAAWSLTLENWGALRLWTEATVYRDLGDQNRAAPDFAEGAEAGLHWDWPREAGSLDLSAGLPWTLDSGWVWAKVHWNAVEGQRLWVAFPWFWGLPASLWGQFCDRRVAVVGTSWSL